MHVLASKTRRTSALLSISLFWGLMLVLSGCSINDDDPIPGEGTAANNANSNASMVNGEAVSSYGKVVNIGQVKAVTEQGTNLKDASCRLEMPKLQGGANNLFIVHTTTDYGINYCMEYDCSLKAQRWSAFQWHNGNAVTNWSRSQWYNTSWGGDPFQIDPLIPSEYRTTLADHKSNGHDRGHILGSQDRMNSKDANMQTFYLSNIHPQLGDFNGDGIWWNLENRLRNTYNKNTFRDTLYVVKGGTIDEGNYTWVKGQGDRLVCPKYFFMALLCKKSSDKTQGGYKAIAFWMEHKANTDDDFKKYAISIDRLEQLTGIDFFCNLPDDIEAQVESNLVTSAWKL